MYYKKQLKKKYLMQEYNKHTIKNINFIALI